MCDRRCSKNLLIFLSTCSVCDRRSWVLLPPEPQRTGGSAGSAGGRAWGAEGGVWAAEIFAGQAGGGAEEAEAAGQRSGGLHWHAAGAHHGAEADPLASAIQVQVRAGSAPQSSLHSNLHDKLLSLLTAMLSFLIQISGHGEMSRKGWLWM